MKKRTITILAVLLGITALSSLAVLVGQKTNLIDRIITRNETNGSYTADLKSLVKGVEETDKELIEQTIKVEDAESPFTQIDLVAKTYGDETHQAKITVDSNIKFDYVSELTLTFKLKEKVNYFVGNVELEELGFVNKDEDKLLKTSVKVGWHNYTLLDNSDRLIYTNTNAYSDEIVITIKNPKVNEEKITTATFTLGAIKFNVFDTNAYKSESTGDF